jgi:hypothetical protein
MFDLLVGVLLCHTPSIEFGVVSQAFLEPLDWTLIHSFPLILMWISFVHMPFFLL